MPYTVIAVCGYASLLLCTANIRLVNGPPDNAELEGRVEVYFNGQWGYCL